MNNHTGIWVVIPNWNGADSVLNSLASLSKQTQDHTVVLVDNGSVDNSVDLVEKHCPKVKIIKNEVNLGFGGGVNTGIRFALDNGAKFIALLNNDAEAEKDWLEWLVKTAGSTPDAGIVTCKFMLSDKIHFDSTGECYSVWGFSFPRDRNQKDLGQRDKGEYVFGATGGASLYKAKALEQVGLFDEDFFAYYEDADISFRMQLAGWKIYYEPQAVAYHKLSATSSKLGNFTRYHATKNFYLLLVKNMPGKLILKYGILFLLKAFSLAATSVFRLKPHVWISGFAAFLKSLPKAMQKRRTIQKNRKVSPDYIESLLNR